MTDTDPKPAERTNSEARYDVFQRFIFEDQRDYYVNKVRRNQRAAGQVNNWHALFALLAGSSSALAALLLAIGIKPPAETCTVVLLGWNCDTWSHILVALPFLSVVFPALAAAFGTLADLYQWDRLESIYEATGKSLKKVHASAPRHHTADADYQTWVETYAMSVLAVMSAEATQWGQEIKTPEALEKFKTDMEARARAASQPPNGQNSEG